MKGYHHHAYAVRVPSGSPLAGDFRWLKLREPRSDVLWYDMRRFRSEERLLQALDGRVPRIPRVSRLPVGAGWMTFTGFIEGTTLDRVPGPVGRVAERFMDQIEELFRALAAVDRPPLPRDGALEWGCAEPADCPDPADSAGSSAFLRGLVHYSVEHAYAAELVSLRDLLGELGMDADTLRDFGRRLPRLTDRRPQLLHADLHRKNLVVDRSGGLWTIDWELALFGDPLYDLATHLHLMAYRPDQEEEMILRWKRAVGAEASLGADEDLPLYRTYKRLQSVYTDIVRGAARLREEGGERRLRGTAALAHKAMTVAKESLGIEKVPPLPAMEAAFSAWCASHPGPASRATADTPQIG
ncbi:phosphotransferase [Streptomyces polygonati]|uniref:Phosphotransferase n=1 Tax=Streptomyces polygonati TaxID=1617087 RepID=A0ABV8HEC0_9ACTN